MIRTLDLVYFDAGGGHRAAALALQQVLATMAGEAPFAVRLVNLCEVLDPEQRFRRFTGLAPEDVYNKRLQSGFTIGLAQELALLQGAIRLAHGWLVPRLVRHWQATRPDLVCSLIPNFNRALGESVARARPGVRFATVMTDMADFPPHFWAEPAVAQHLVCGTAHAVAQARAAGVPAARVHAVSGMILRPSFHAPRPSAEARRLERQRLGLPEEAPVGLVLFGGHGSRAMLKIARRLPEVPLILLCGRNEALAEALRTESRAARAPRVVVGFTPEVAHHMALADFFVGKPGPGSLSEAVQMGLPVIVTRNAWTLPQERWNTEWVRTMGVGVVHRSFATIHEAVAEVLAHLPALRERVAAQRNDAVFEVARWLLRALPRPEADARDGRTGEAAPPAEVMSPG
jgi:1,2-diacylglycerol 3-beta-galactosyltransferase